MKKTIRFLALWVAMYGSSIAATAVTDFSTAETVSGATFSDTWAGAYVDNSTFGTIGSPATDFGGMIYVLGSPISIGGDTLINVAARVDSGNTATGFSVILYNDFSNYAYANFSTSSLTSSFSTLSLSYVTVGAFDAANVVAWGLSGGSPSSTTTFRVSFDSITTSAIPEPSTYAGLLGLAALGFGACRRRRAA